jgi:dolichol-phosphate mannosyltransferase
MLAGIDHASGDAIICMDSDGQHPPKELKNIINAFEDKHEIVLMERTMNHGSNNVNKYLSKRFYKLINKLSDIQFQENSTDFFLISKRVAIIFQEYFREQNRFIRGFVQSVGFDTSVLKFEASSRISGESKYSYKALIKLAINAIFSFSNKPLRLSILISMLFILFTVILSAFSLYQYFFGNKPPSGYTTIIIFMSVGFSLQETRKRPLYIIKSIQKV